MFLFGPKKLGRRSAFLVSGAFAAIFLGIALLPPLIRVIHSLLK